MKQDEMGMGEIENAYILVLKPEVKELLGRHTHIGK
jgi:hypothetical protein